MQEKSGRHKLLKANRLSGVSLVDESPSPQLDYSGVVLVVTILVMVLTYFGVSFITVSGRYHYYHLLFFKCKQKDGIILKNMSQCIFSNWPDY